VNLPQRLQERDNLIQATSKQDILYLGHLTLRRSFIKIQRLGSSSARLHQTLQAPLRLGNLSRHFTSTRVTNMPPITVSSQSSDEYDLMVIGGGSGGLGCARRAAKKFGIKAAIVEGSGKLGGTCVNVGCVPKKIMWYTADLSEKLHEAAGYGFDVDPKTKFEWSTIKNKRDAYIRRLNGIYDSNLVKDKVDYLSGWAKMLSPNEVEVTLNETGDKKVYRTKHIVIATGGEPVIPEGIPGSEHGITSDGFFLLDKQPKRVALVGAGYIAVEFAGIFNALGSDTHLFIRHDRFLRTFDPMVQDVLFEAYETAGVKLHGQSSVYKVEKNADGSLTLHYKDHGNDSDSTMVVDTLLWSIGRSPNVEYVGAKDVGVKLNQKGHVIVDDYQKTNLPNVYALGDVCDRGFELTPIALSAGRLLAERLFGKDDNKSKTLKLLYQNVPSAVFGHPEVGTIGMTEPEARKKFGDADIKIYKTRFTPMYYAMTDDKVPTAYKMVCQGPEEKVVGLHLLGKDSAELIQGFAVAVKMGATKDDFDACTSVHPTSGEEVVTLV